MEEWWSFPLVLACVAACAPSVVAPADDDTTSASSSSSSSSSSSMTPADITTTIDPDTTTTTGAPTDADLCVSWCLNAEARGCADAFIGETCYARCLDTIMYAELGACADEHRDVLACEASASPPAEPSCEALECEQVYIRDDLCHGFCAHLGAIPGSGGSQTDCDWRGTACYGHDLEVVCPLDDAAAPCDCIVDDSVVAQCEVGEALEAFECGGEDMHIFTSCCREAFEGVLLP